ncbi:hypothetical protein TNCV_489741 [Trichonephila clavipes]|nr:hypothetical protein TNCV_489741 [Trichonephila clavipes]
MCEGGNNDLAKCIDISVKCCLREDIHPAKLAWLLKELSLSPKSTGFSSSCSSYLTMDGSRAGLLTGAAVYSFFLAVGSLVVRASDSRPEGLGSMSDATKYPPSTHGVRAR